jgi:phosphoribosylamine--glycine ligase
MTEKVGGRVGLVMGSSSDAETMKAAYEVLESLGIASEVRVLSAHRTPTEAISWVSGARERGIRVIIAAAGLAAHLAGIAAAHTTLPVIGVPMEGGPLKGLDALLSTVQMPKGTPVATVAIGKAGAANAALLAARILAVENEKLTSALEAYQRKLADEVLSADVKLG